MTHSELAKWQQALKYWGKWTESIRKTREDITAKHGSLSELWAQAKFEVNEETKNSTHKSLMFILNDEMRAAWDIDDEIRSLAGDFVTKELGLCSSSSLYTAFVDYWMKSALPEFNYGKEQDPHTEAGEINPLRCLTLASKRVKCGGEYQIRNSVSWYQGYVKTQEVLRFLQKTKWPFDTGKVDREGKGGRPQLPRQRVYSEAVVCYVLNKKQGIKQHIIAGIFRWNTHYDSYGNLMSNTVRNRVKLGRQLLGNPERKITNK